MRGPSTSFSTIWHLRRQVRELQRDLIKIAGLEIAAAVKMKKKFDNNVVKESRKDLFATCWQGLDLRVQVVGRCGTGTVRDWWRNSAILACGRHHFITSCFVGFFNIASLRTMRFVGIMGTYCGDLILFANNLNVKSH